MLYKFGSNNSKMLSYDPQGIDYVSGENTVTAVKEFQEANNLTVDGIVDVEARQALFENDSKNQTIGYGHVITSGENFDSLVSFAYNYGANSLKYSPLLKDAKAGSTDEKIKKDFLMWCNYN
ncbi:peptidoglycan-binding protein [Clostridium saccharobutylicum]|uniref:Lysozyme n=1 Tax=Clostridium saccharobutylicum DSM 13864 TaxID=1345695 RepID=U5MXB2_CLOSA|nr:peptidoglycan-binding protein [Clostridium saccharobutylicum]AGX45399.1 putative peptidoglycan-binding domain-containing protein [Clostridium saccharobutylicum DSM 13864]AQR92674.1 putative peptidoglycan binding domain protein [Clostridium saccharobutylicum]AQS02576.1 putative peptidoglycan binding domain protein [Clostridium saccharobutylicum]AQS12182.1 putative peptidoglycan binding domain protein [Clostridium saccharobutylicum]AQS16559.1 putative peptidoglycan binding domain protein [Clo